MTEENNKDDFYKRLTEQLREDSAWPSPYMFKFIVPAVLEKIAEIEAVFNNTDANIQTRDSAKGTYTSVSIKVVMNSPEEVVKKYIEVSKVEGVISL